MVHKTQDKKLKIEQHEPEKKPTVGFYFIVINFELTVKYVYTYTE